jgi:hypothetical protein
MIKVVSLVTASFLANSVAANSGDKLHFVHEVVRHGARAPVAEHTGFKQDPGDLTSQGMRQRFLLGTRNRERYID